MLLFLKDKIAFKQSVQQCRAFLYIKKETSVILYQEEITLTVLLTFFVPPPPFPLNVVQPLHYIYPCCFVLSFLFECNSKTSIKYPVGILFYV